MCNKTTYQLDNNMKAKQEQEEKKCNSCIFVSTATYIITFMGCILKALTWYFIVTGILDTMTLLYCEDYRMVNSAMPQQQGEGKGQCTTTNNNFKLLDSKSAYDENKKFRANMCFQSIDILDQLRSKMVLVLQYASLLDNSSGSSSGGSIDEVNDTNNIDDEQQKEELIKQLSLHVPNYVNEQSSSTIDALPFEERVEKVKWGGDSSSNKNEWWSLSSSIAGYSLLKSYLEIMKYSPNLISSFPYKPCSKKPYCHSSFALYHTLNFRETYKPWLVTPSMKDENKLGFIYHYGYHGIDQESSLIWYTPSIHKPTNDEVYIRCIIHTIESAIYKSITKQSQSENNAPAGKYYVIINCKSFILSQFPNFDNVKRIVTILQDHYPNTLQKVILINSNAHTTQFDNLIWDSITNDVHKKVIKIRNDGKRYVTLKELLGFDSSSVADSGSVIPKSFLDVSSTSVVDNEYVFDAETYYKENGVSGSEEMALEYLSKMPYHA